MVGGDRRSPPRYKAKGGGGKGKGGGSNKELRNGIEGSLMIGETKLTTKNGEKFQFGSCPIDVNLQQVDSSCEGLQGDLWPDGTSSDILKPNSAMVSPISNLEENNPQIRTHSVTPTSISCGNKSWAMEVEACEALQRQMDCSGEVATSGCAMENSSLLSMDESLWQSRHSLIDRAKFSEEDKADSLQGGDAQDRILNPCAAGMDYTGLSSSSNAMPQSAVYGSTDCANKDVDCCMLEISGKNGCSDSSDLHSTPNCTQGACALASTELGAANVYVNDGLMNIRNSALSSPMVADNSFEYEPMQGPPISTQAVKTTRKCAVNICVNSGFMVDGKSAPNSGSFPPMAAVNLLNHAGNYSSPHVHSAGFSQQSLNASTKTNHGMSCSMNDPLLSKRATQTSNAWKKPEHIRVDENDLKYISDDGCSLAFDIDAYETNKGRLERGLIGKIIGRKLPLHILDQELSRRWSFVGGFRTVLLSGDYFLCIFESTEARDTILWGGPWQILGHIIGLDKWSPNFNSESLNGLSAPIWVRLPKLPLLFWDKKTISRIGAMIGKPLWIDAQTTIWGRCEYARICVRMDLSKRLPTGVWIKEHSSRFFQPIEYEGITLLCFHCGIVGHKADSCQNARTLGTKFVRETVHSMIENVTSDEVPKTLAPDKPPDSGGNKEADTSHMEKPSMATTRGLTTNLDTLEGEKEYGPWILVTRKRKPTSNSGRFQPSNFRTPPSATIGVVPPPLETFEKEGMVIESVDEGHILKAQVDTIAANPPQATVGSPAHHEPTSVVGNMEVATSHQPHSRSGKERISKAHFEKELLQLGPIALKSRKRKKKVTVAGAEQCLRDFTQASSSGGGDASPSRGK